jgi:predicted RNA polymerase sigma factor
VCGAGDHVATLRRKEDTAAGCRELAAASLSLILPTGTLNEQHRFEHSAVMWTARADLLARLELRTDMASATKRSQLDEPFLLHSEESSSYA